MADLILKKESQGERFRTGFGGTFFFYLALALFFLSLAGFGGLALLNRAQEVAFEETKEQIKAKEENLRPELIQQILILDQRLTNLRMLISGHIFVSNVLDLVETGAHPQTQFTNFGLNTETRRIDLSGETASYLTLAQQIELFEKNAQVERVDFGNLSLGNANRLGFKMVISLKQGFLHIRP